MGEVLTVHLGAPGVSYTANFNVDEGTGFGRWHGSPTGSWVPVRRQIRRAVEFGPLTAEESELVRAFAAKMRERGDYHYRDQFAQAGFNITLSGDSKIHWAFDVDGGPPLEVKPLCDLAADCVFRAVRQQRETEAAEPSLLPDVDQSALLAIHRETAPWLPATERVAARHGVEAERWERAGDGSQIVMLSEKYVIKLYVPFWPQIIDHEEAALDVVRFDLELDTPRIRGRGELDGWDYLVVERVPGTPWASIRDELTADEELRLAADLGAFCRQLHDLKVPKDASLRESQSTWRAFLSDHRKRRGELERARGTSETWAELVVEHLKPWRYRKRKTETFLHADLTDEHIMLTQGEDGWRLSGIIDFGDAKIGDPAYEFAAPFMSWTARRPDLRRAMLDAYGGVDDAFVDRIFEAILLHEFACLGALDLEGLSTIDDVRQRYCAL